MPDTLGGRLPPTLKMSPDEYVDTTFQAYGERISDDYDYILRKIIVPGLPSVGDLRLRELRILSCLDFFEPPLAPMQLSELLRFDPATVTRSVNNLVKAGMVIKRNNRRDTRGVLLSLTTKGQVMADNFNRRIRMAFKFLEKDMIHGLTDEEKVQYLNIVVKISRRAQTMRAMCENYEWDFDTGGPVAKPIY
jgi:DNA-binding MarR family transcriptional regulator